VLTLEGRSALKIRGRSVQLADLADLIGATAPPLPAGSPAIVVTAGGRRVAATCDRLLGQDEVILKPLGAFLASTPGYLGAAILGDGRVALLLDPNSLSRASESRPRLAPAPAAREKALAPKILVVEDSFTVRELQRSILQAAGYRVEIACDGRDGLDRVSADPEIDLVITDLEMPKLNGLELTRAIRARAESSSLPVVIVTSLGTDDDRRAGVEAGADAYMVKASFDQHACSTPSSGWSACDAPSDPRSRLRRLADLYRCTRPHARTRRRDRGRRSDKHRRGSDRRPRAAGPRPRDDGHRAARNVGARGGRGDHERATDPDPHPSSHVGTTNNVAAAALASGALDAIGKEGIPLMSPDDAAAFAFRRRVKLLGAARVIRHPRARLNGSSLSQSPAAPHGSVIGICASTGGPHALATLLAGIPAGFPIPILVVQHIAGGILGRPRTLAQRHRAPAGAARRERRAGTPRRHARTRRRRPHPAARRVSHSRSHDAGRAAPALGRRPPTEHRVVCTRRGRGGRPDRDGPRRRRRARGGPRGGWATIAQDEETSAVYGMPYEAAKSGAVTILPIGKIAEALTAIVVERSQASG
jgi:chemotaxis response regulator CheB